MIRNTVIVRRGNEPIEDEMRESIFRLFGHS